jgi:hypothetical protein
MGPLAFGVYFIASNLSPTVGTGHMPVVPRETKVQHVTPPKETNADVEPPATSQKLLSLGGGPLTAMVILSQLTGVATGVGYAVYRHNGEAQLKAKIMPSLGDGNADPLAFPMAAVMFHLFVIQWLGYHVNTAMYTESPHPNAVAYDCARRAYQHAIEQTPVVFGTLAVASVEFPLCAAAGVGFFSLAKVVGNIFGYAGGNARHKNWGAFGYLGLFPVFGLAVIATMLRLGLEPHATFGRVAASTTVAVAAAADATATACGSVAAQASAAMEQVGPLANDAYATAAPFCASAAAYASGAAGTAGSAMVEAAGTAAQSAAPYVSAAVEGGKAYCTAAIEAAVENAAPYCESAKDAVKGAAMPYVDAAAAVTAPYYESAVAATTPYYETAVAATAPYVNATAEAAAAAVAAAAPYVDATAEAAAPYVSAAAEACGAAMAAAAPYVNATAEVAAPYVIPAVEAAAPYVTAAAEACQPYYDVVKAQVGM